jgi:general secretion pathway protein I
MDRGVSMSIRLPTGRARLARRDRSTSPPARAFAPPKASAQRGYTLIEVIAAFALLALALTLLLGSLSGALRQVRGAADRGRAALHARSLIDQVGVGEPLRTGTRSGELEDGRYRWTLDVARWRDPVATGGPVDPAAPQLLEVRLGLQWGDGGPREQLQLRTLRMQAAGVEATLP